VRLLRIKQLVEHGAIEVGEWGQADALQVAFHAGNCRLVMLINFSGEQLESGIAVVLTDGQFM
jgi:hypothetical protein